MNNDINHDTVLLVCDDEKRAKEILSQFYSKGWSVVGPVSTAAMALSLTAQTCPTVALMAGRPVDRRRAPELADDLMRTWGVRSVMLDEALDKDDAKPSRKRSWAARPSQEERIRDVIGL
jgi:hypothetical protein